ncbi:MAG: Uma2 family endonuclease [Anaerolineae bacterium]
MVVQQPAHLYTIEDFRAFIAQPENEDRLFELIDGEIIEVSPGRTSNSEYRDLIAFSARAFCHEHKLPCYTSGEGGAYEVQGEVVAPDFAYKPTPMSKEYPDPVPPLWVVEIVSPTDKAKDIRAKRNVYRRAGILLWEVYPEAQSVDAYVPGKEVQVFGIDDVLEVGDILPGFKLSVRDIFSDPLAE